jgi:MarR family transcriptional regulator for hemolysin
MVSVLPSFERSLGFVLSDITRLARKEFDRRVRPLRLTRAQWLFLYYVAREPGCTQADLAEAMQMEKITIGRQASRLLRTGWIIRRDHADDRRAYRLHLSAKAQRVVAQLADMATHLRDDYLRGLPAARRTALMEDLLHIKENLLHMDAVAKKPSRAHDPK